MRKIITIGALILAGCVSPGEREKVDVSVTPASSHMVELIDLIKERQDHPAITNMRKHNFDWGEGLAFELQSDGRLYALGIRPEPNGEVGFYLSTDNDKIYVDRPIDGTLDEVMYLKPPRRIERNCEGEQRGFNQKIEELLKLYQNEE